MAARYLDTVSFDVLANLCHKRGWKLERRSDTHWQIVNAPLLVNVYPDTRKGVRIYVARTTLGRGVKSIGEILTAAETAPAIAQYHLRDDRRANKTKSRKRRLLARYPYCQWCKTPLTIETATIEHVVPLARGGLDNMNNMVLACEPCNKDRGHNMPELESRTA